MSAHVEQEIKRRLDGRFWRYRMQDSAFIETRVPVDFVPNYTVLEADYGARNSGKTKRKPRDVYAQLLMACAEAVEQGISLTESRSRLSVRFNVSHASVDKAFADVYEAKGGSKRRGRYGRPKTK